MLSKLLRFFRKRAKRSERNQDQRIFNPLYTFYTAFDARRVILDAMPNLIKPTQGTVKNFLGVKVPVQVMPSILSKLAGTVEAAFKTRKLACRH